jgi:hypothetical protein
MQSTKDAKTVGIAWYKREDYPELRGVMHDAHVLPLTYDGWLRLAVGVVKLEQAKGSRIVKAMIDPKMFVAWCRATGQRIDAAARTRYVNLEIENFCSIVRATEIKRQELLRLRRELDATQRQQAV